MERCLHKHSFDYLKQNNTLSLYHFQFQSGDFTVNQLVYLYNKFIKAFVDGNKIRVFFFVTLVKRLTEFGIRN